jgi:hypothetical protein
VKYHIYERDHTFGSIPFDDNPYEGIAAAVDHAREFARRTGASVLVQDEHGGDVFEAKGPNWLWLTTHRRPT